MSEKQVVFDTDGNPKELRYYEHDRLVARLGVILDGDKNFIGLRELSVAEVSPPSWLERLGFKKAVQPKRIDILTVDFIGLINWINTIKTIKTIENVDLLKEITTIKNIESVDLIDFITRIALIDNITNVGTLNLLNTVNLIKSISSIDNITNIENVTQIGEITSLPEFQIFSYIKNHDFQYGDSRGWYFNGAVIETGGQVYPNYCAKIAGSGGYIYQRLVKPIPTNAILKFSAYLKSSATTKQFQVTFVYSDHSSSIQTINVTADWLVYDLTPTAGKYLTDFYVENWQDNYAWACGFNLAVAETVVATDLDIRALVSTTDSVEAKQATRTNFKAQTEREDLLLQSGDLASSAGPQEVLGAQAGLKNKVYGWDYYCDAAGTFEFQATVSGVLRKFGRRKTAGVHAMTLVHPIVCDVNTALNFLSNGGNTYYSLRCKIEA